MSTVPTPRPSPPPRRAAIVRLTGGLWGTFREDWRRLPPGSVTRWLATLAVGWVIAAAVAVAVTLIGQRWHGQGMQQWDERWLLWLAEHGPLSYSNAILLESFGNLAYMIPLVLLAAGLCIRAHRPMAALTIVAAYVLQRPLFMIGWMIWDRARPTLIAEGVASPALHSYPSGHVALTIAGYGLLAWLWFSASRSVLERIAIVLLLVALVVTVAIARIVLGTHWPSDTLSAAVLATVWLAAVILALARAERPPAQLDPAPAPQTSAPLHDPGEPNPRIQR